MSWCGPTTLPSLPHACSSPLKVKDRRREGVKGTGKRPLEDDQPKKWAGLSGGVASPAPNVHSERIPEFLCESGGSVNLVPSGMQTLLPKDLCMWQNFSRTLSNVSLQPLLSSTPLVPQVQ